jgi:hypothetical protein
MCRDITSLNVARRACQLTQRAPSDGVRPTRGPSLCFNSLAPSSSQHADAQRAADAPIAELPGRDSARVITDRRPIGDGRGREQHGPTAPHVCEKPPSSYSPVEVPRVESSGECEPRHSATVGDPHTVGNEAFLETKRAAPAVRSHAKARSQWTAQMSPKVRSYTAVEMQRRFASSTLMLN